MKKLLLLFFVLLVFPLAQALTVTHTGNFTAGDSLNITINMEGASYTGNLFWNTTSSNNLTWSLVEGDGTFSSTGDNYTFHANDSGVVTLGLTGNVSETFNFTAYNGSSTNSSNITVNPDSAVTFYMSHDGGAIVGVAENLAFSARDTYNNTDTNYNGDVILTTTAADPSTLIWSAGVNEWDGSGNWEYTFTSGSATLTLNNTYVEALTVTSSLAGMTSFTSDTLTFSHAGIDHFSLTHDGYGVVNTAETLTLIAQDAFNNTVSNYTGDVFLDSNVSASNTLTWSEVHLVLSSEGSETFTVTSNTSQQFFVNATDLNNITGTSSSLVFADPSLSVSASSGDVGDSITVNGTGFEANSSVTVALSSVTNTTTTDSSGELSVTLIVPQVANGTYNITAGTVNVEFTVNTTYVGFAVTSPSAVTITNPVLGSTGTTSFVVSALGNMDVNITNITVTNLTNDVLNYTIDSVSFDSTSFVFGWNSTNTVTSTVTLTGTPIDGTYTGIATVTDSNGNTNSVNLSTVLQTGTYGLSVASTSSISGDTDDTTKTTSLSVINNGSLDLSNVVLSYASSDSSNGKVSFSTSGFSLSSGSSQSVTVTADITDLSVGTYTGTITVTTTEGNSATSTLTITVSEAPEDVFSFYDVDSNEENNLDDGEELNSIKPGSTLTLEVVIKNHANFDLEDVVVKATIEDIDDGDDLEVDDYNIGNLDDGDKEEATFSFDIPWELDKNNYDLVLEVEGEDDDGEEYSKEMTIRLDVEKKNHDVAISDLDLGLSTLQCVRSTSLSVDLTNIGDRDESDALFTVESSELGIDFMKDNIDLDEAETYSESIAIHVDDDFAAGTYTIAIRAYYDEDEYDDNDMTDYRAVSLVVEDCGTTTAPTTTPTEPTTTTTTTITPIPTTTEISFTDSSGYVLTLVLVNILLLVGILSVVVKTFIPKK